MVFSPEKVLSAGLRFAACDTPLSDMNGLSQNQHISPKDMRLKQTLPWQLSPSFSLLTICPLVNSHPFPHNLEVKIQKKAEERREKLAGILKT